MRGLLRSFIREVIEELDEEELDEFSTTAGVGGGLVAPLGTDAYYPGPKIGKKKKKVNVSEANTVAGAGLGPITYPDLDGDGDPDGRAPIKRNREQAYYDSVEALARAYGGAESPFKKIKA